MKKLILKLFGFSREEVYLFESVKSAESVRDVVPHMRRHLRSPKYAGVRQHAVSHMRKTLGR